MGQTKKALKKAIESGETDLVYLVLFHMMENMSPQQLYIVMADPTEGTFFIARDLLIAYCKTQRIDYLKEFFRISQMHQETASIFVYEYCHTLDSKKKQELLNQALNTFKLRRDLADDAKVLYSCIV
jgi:hypothetical protein